MTSHQSGRLLDVLLALAIFAVALVPRLEAARSYDIAPQSEEKLYDRYAWKWAQGEGAEPRDKFIEWHPLGSFTHRPPLYALFLGTLYWLFGHDYGVVRVVQAGLGALVCVLVFVVGHQLAGRWAGLAAGLVMANYSFLIGFVPRLMSETLFLLLLLVFLALMLRVRGDPRLAVVFGAGIALGLANLTRPVLLLPFVPLLLAWLWLAPAVRRRVIPVVAALGLGGALVVLPVTWRNYQFHGEFVLISSNSGFTFFHGVSRTAGLTNPDALPSKDEVQDLGLPELEEQGRFQSLAVDYLRRYPQDILTVVADQATYFVDAKQGYKVSDEVIPTPEDPVLWPTVALGSLAGLAVFALRGFQGAGLLYLTVVSQVLMGLVFHMEIRYRLPLVPLLTILTCAAVWIAARDIVALAQTVWRRRAAAAR